MRQSQKKQRTAPFPCPQRTVSVASARNAEGRTKRPTLSRDVLETLPNGASSSVRAARAALHGVPPLARDEGNHREGRGGIAPPPAEPGVEANSDQQDRGEVGAHLSLPRFGFKRPASESRRDATLGAREE